MHNRVNEYESRFEALKSDVSIDEKTRFAKVYALASEAVESLQEDAGFLLGRLSYCDRPAYIAVAQTVEAKHATGRCDREFSTQPPHCSLFLIPVVIEHGAGTTIPREFGLTLPPLPDKRQIPGLVEFLLTWEELTTKFSQTEFLRGILLKVRDGLPQADAKIALQRVFGEGPSDAVMDRIDLPVGGMSSLRFIPALALHTDIPWFNSFDEKSAWQRSTLPYLANLFPQGIYLYPQPPNDYVTALAVAESLFLQMFLRELIAVADNEEGRKGTAKEGAAELLFEPFGSPGVGIAGYFKVSSVPAGSVTNPYHRIVFKVPVAREWAFWEETGAKFAKIAREQLGRDSKVATSIQDQDHLFPQSGGHRLHFILGACVAFTPPGPDGFPFAFGNVAGDNEELRKWIDYELNEVGSGVEFLAATLKAVFELEASPSIWSFSFVLQDGVWRPSFVIYLHGMRNSSGGRLPHLLDKASLDSVGSMFGMFAGRAWVAIVEAGQYESDAPAGRRP